MNTPLVSVVTPTFGRPEFLPLIYDCVKKQTWPSVEWLVEDDSPEPSEFMIGLQEPWITYRHSTKRHNIGAKRNALVALAKGDYIAHFDDDDYYSPHYVGYMMEVLLSCQVDICKLSAFFVLHRRLSTFAYCDLFVKTGIHFVWTDSSLRAHCLSDEDNRQLIYSHYGYGFSYVYKKGIWLDGGFPDVNWNEDALFIEAAIKAASVKMVPDQTGLCLHLVHGQSTSRCFPQFVLPWFLVDRLFADAGEYLTSISGGP